MGSQRTVGLPQTTGAPLVPRRICPSAGSLPQESQETGSRPGAACSVPWALALRLLRAILCRDLSCLRYVGLRSVTLSFPWPASHTQTRGNLEDRGPHQTHPETHRLRDEGSHVSRKATGRERAWDGDLP